MLAVSVLHHHLTTCNSERNLDVNPIDFESNIEGKRLSTRSRGIFPRKSIVGEQSGSLPRQQGTYAIIPVYAFCIIRNPAKAVRNVLNIMLRVMFGTSSRVAA